MTSREPLNISGERLWAVEPLPVSEPDNAAVRVFVDRAESVRPLWAPRCQDALAEWLVALSALPEIYRGDRAVGLLVASQAVPASDATNCSSAPAGARYVLAEGLVGDDDSAARQHLDEAVFLAECVGASYVAGLAHLSLATLEARSGNLRASLLRYAVLVDMWRRSGNWAQQ